MTPRPYSSLPPLAALAGTAAWCSRGVMDVVAVEGGGVRLALLAAPVTWLPTVLLVLAGMAGWLAVVARWRRRRLARLGLPAEEGHGLAPTSLLAPLWASGLVLLTWMPWLPDVVPPLRLLAAPFGLLLWGVLIGLVVVHSLAWIAGGAPGQGPARPRRRFAPWWIWAAGLVLIGAAAWRITQTPLLPSGDEPHYLVIAQSLWRDGDLRIQDNHDRGDYREYYDRALEPHFLTRGTDGEIYSIHPVGLPVLLAPVYAIGGYPFVVFFLVLIGTTAATLAWRLAREVTGSGEAATLAWMGVALSVPLVFNAFSVYPEIVAALLVMVAFATGRSGDGLADDRPWRWWIAGLCLTALPWLSSKYALMTLALAIVLGARAVWPPGSAPDRQAGLTAGARARVIAIVVPGVLGAAAWFAFFQWIWGSPSPAAPYGAMLQTSVRYLAFGMPGLLFDQEYGIFVYAPVLVVGTVGLWQMWRLGNGERRLAIEVVAVFLALLAAVGAFRLWWGDASPGRPVIAGLLLWMVPVAWYAALAATRGARAWAWLLALVGVGVTVIAATAQEGLLVASTRDGLSRLLQWLGGMHPLSTAAPSFIGYHWSVGGPVTSLWLVLAGLATWWVARAEGVARAPLAAVAAIVAGGVLVPALFGARLPAAPAAGAAARSPLLDAYSATARPIAVRFAPFSVERAEAALSHVRLLATPGLRTDPQPMPVLLNMRLSLPAGRYRATLSFAPLPPGDRGVGLRVGRVGPPYLRFELPPSGASSSLEFQLPVDANFVGFETSRAVAAAIRRIEVTAVSVVDATRRTPVGQVLAGQAYPGADLFAHDELSWLEAEGAWVIARRTASFSVVPRRDGPVRVRLRNGPVANVVVLTGHGWLRRVPLDGDATTDLDLPAPEAGGAFALRVVTEQGFVPIDRDPAARDRRFLGVFVSFP